MLEIVGQILLSILLLTGSLLALLAAVGLHRFPDVFCRMHAATKPATLGVVLVVFAAGLTIDQQGAFLKMGLVAVLQLLTTPVGAHMIGRAAYGSGAPMSEQTVMDELGRSPDMEVYGPSP